MSIQVQTVVDKLGAKKSVFLENVEGAVYSNIAGQSWRGCLTIRQMYSNGNVKSTWRPNASKDYLGRLVAFTRGKKYKDGYSYYELDSGLTPGVVNVVTKEFEKFYTSEDFSKMLSEQLMRDRVFVDKLASSIVDATNGTLPTALRQQLATQLVHILENMLGDSLQKTAGKFIVVGISKAAGLVVASGVSKAVMAVMMKNMVLLLKGALAKVLATTAIKTTLISLAKKAAAAKIIALLAALLSPILAKITASIAIPFAWVAAPVLIGILAWIINNEAENLPRNMGEKVSKAVRDELNGNFERLNQNVVTEVIKNLTTDLLSDLAMNTAKDLVKDEEFRATLSQLGNSTQKAA